MDSNPMFADCNAIDEVVVILWRQTPADERLANVTALLADPRLDRVDLKAIAKKLKKAGLVELAELAATQAKTARRRQKRSKPRFRIPWR